jgi:replication-associated recombination protein RarA
VEIQGGGVLSLRARKENMNHKQVITRAVLRLNKTQKKTLLKHMESKTPICCGDRAGRYIDGQGGG